MKTWLWWIPILALTACSYRVDKGEDGASTTNVQMNWAEVNAQILEPKCARCHEGEFVGSYEATRALLGAISARVQSTSPGSMMPPAGSPALTASEKAALLAWIQRGAPRDSTEAPPTNPAPAEPPPSPPPPEQPPPLDPTRPNFALVKAAVFDQKCASCHHHEKRQHFTSYANFLPLLQEDLEFRISVQALGTEEQMPPANKPQLTDEERKLILLWIRNGAPEN